LCFLCALSVQMNPNSYRLQTDDVVDVADIAALLEELKDVGGAVEDAKGTAAGRPLSEKTVRRGIVGGTNVLKEQQRSDTTAPGLSLHRRSNAGAGGGGGNKNNGTGKRKASAGAAAGSLAPLGFSTYDTANAAMMEAQLQQQLQPQLSSTPLGIRLAPLTTLDDVDAAGHGLPSSDAVRLPTSPPKRVHPAPLPDTPTSMKSSTGTVGHRPSLSSQSALPPLPSLPKRKDSAANAEEGADTNNSGGGSGKPHLRLATGVAPGGTSGVPVAGSSFSNGAAEPAEGGVSSVAAPREINFLPIMCARYLRPVGLTPTARWGHSLTHITPDVMLLFGGIDVNGTETASLMSFNPTTISWDPLYTMTDTPVARHSHAACAYDGRYLVISGGVAQHSGRVLDDIHLYDIYTHHWRCLWNGEREGSRQNRNEPGPRFGHSVVLHEDRLFLYGGKTVVVVGPDAAGGGRRRGSNTSFSSKGATLGVTDNTTAAATLTSGSDVYVFSLNSYRWRRRLHCTKGRRSTSVTGTGSTAVDLNVSGEDQQEGSVELLPTRPSARAYHAACARGSLMFVNGGAGTAGVLTDTWAVDLTTGLWRCIHRGGTADAVPRERHALFVCGEALLLVGGCSGGGGLHERITDKFTNFAVVLPLVGAAVEMPCWIPVAMGNVSIVAPSKRSFGAALSGGFVYVFGGVSGAEPATNTMIRFLAADGCISQYDPVGGTGGSGTASAVAAGAQQQQQQLRLVLQQLREQQRGTPYDIYAYAGTYGSISDVAAVVAQLPMPWAGASATDDAPAPTPNPASSSNKKNTKVVADESAVGRSDVAMVGLHRAIVQQRAPLFLQELEKCRSDLFRGVGGGGGGGTADAGGNTPQRRTTSLAAASSPNNEADGSGDEVDALLREVGGGGSGATLQKGEDASGGSSSGSSCDGLPVFYTNGTTRIPGLAQPLTAEALQCLVDYVYWGGLKGKYRVLLEEKDEADATTGGDVSEGGEKNEGGSFSAEYRAQLTQTLQTVKAAAEAYKLAPLQELCTALLSGSREMMGSARQRCSAQLRVDMEGLMNAPSYTNTTMLVVDPHTKAKAAHVLHASVLMAASGLFTELLRPLYRASAGFGNAKASNQVGPLAAKLSATAAQSPTTLLTSTSKRTVLIGPVPLPLPAVRPILRYLYTQELQVSGELAFEVMLGAHQLGLTELQALCEAVVAREEVNYQTCCTFYYLSRKYQASLLEEISLLTAVSGFAEVRYTAAYQSLSDEEKHNIDAVATELGSASWVPPPQPTQEIKSKAAYAARWESSAPA
jgi:hypothetical protein